MKKPISMRVATPADGELLAKWLSAPQALQWFPMINEREIQDSVRLWTTYASTGAGLAAEWDGVTCGLTNLYIQPYKKLAHQCLFSIIVDEDYRGKGVGSALLTALAKHAKENFQIEILHLEVYQGNPAMRLYRRFGFEEFGCQTHFIKEEGRYTGKVLMQKYL